MTKKKKLKALTLTEQETLLGGVYLAAELTVIPAAITLLGEQVGGFSDSTANYLYYWLNAVCCGWIFRNMLHDSLVNAGERMGAFLGTVFVGFLILLGANQLITGLTELLVPGFINSNNEAVARMVRDHPVTMTIGTVALAPVAEECLFRGLLFTGLLAKRREGAYAVSALMFCAVHVLGYLGSVDTLRFVLCFLQYIPAGLVLAWSCEKTGSLLAPMLIHAAINAGSVISLF